VLLTSDRNIKYQQNMAGRNISILILIAKTNRLKDLLPLMSACAQALLTISPGRFVEVGPRSSRLREIKKGGIEYSVPAPGRGAAGLIACGRAARR
jgi:hypothetical protein